MKKYILQLMLVFLNTNLMAQIDNAFNSGGSGANSTINCVALQTDGKIIIGGSFVQYNTSAKNRIVRLNSNGSIDNTFSVGSGASDVVYCIAIQSDGKIIVGGNFTQFNGVAKNRIVRLTSSGAIDNTFNIGSGASDAIRAIAVQTDGKILLGGSFAQFKGVAKGKIVRITSLGAIDNTFNSGGAGFNASGAAYALVVQPDGKILVGGSFVQYNSTAKGRLVRLTSSGGIDSGFNSGGSGANSDVKTIKLQPDGKILVGGSFVQFNTSAKGRIVRLTSSGGIDSGFNSGGSGASDIVNSITLQSNNKIILGGNFSQFNTSAKTRIVRLTTTGVIDNTFSAGSGASSTINALATQSNGGLVAVGSFVQFNTTAVGRIVRLKNSIQKNSLSSENEFETSSNNISIYPNPFIDEFSFQINGVPESLYNIMIYTINGILIESQSINLNYTNENIIPINMEKYPAGYYIVTVFSDNKSYSKKIIKQ